MSQAVIQDWRLFVYGMSSDQPNSQSDGFDSTKLISTHGWYTNAARILSAVSICCIATGFIVCGFFAYITISTPEEGSEWGRFGSAGGLFGICWFLSIELFLVTGVIFGGIVLLLTAFSKPRFSGPWKWGLVGTAVGGTLLATHIVLWLVFYHWLDPYPADVLDLIFRPLLYLVYN
ncbi:MAG: hypothetical protein SVY53_09495 [Chloroflexota bacterium]|nr:hypothetical protein [Chloroflexota bacterium]